VARCGRNTKLPAEDAIMRYKLSFTELRCRIFSPQISVKLMNNSDRQTISLVFYALANLLSRDKAP
jgi:hypothetical protein